MSAGRNKNARTSMRKTQQAKAARLSAERRERLKHERRKKKVLEVLDKAV